MLNILENVKFYCIYHGLLYFFFMCLQNILKNVNIHQLYCLGYNCLVMHLSKIPRFNYRKFNYTSNILWCRYHIYIIFSFKISYFHLWVKQILDFWRNFNYLCIKFHNWEKLTLNASFGVCVYIVKIEW